MSDEFIDKLEALIGEQRQAEVTERQNQENEERFKRLESRFDEIGNLINERIPEKSPAAGSLEPSAGDRGEETPSGNEADPPPTVTPEPEIQIERIKHFNVPKIYSGDDEPEIVTFIDAEDGETKTRKGRKKNRPTMYDVEEAIVEPEGRPQEPGEATA